MSFPPLHYNRAGTAMVFAGVQHHAADAYCKGRIAIPPCLRCYSHRHLFIYLATTPNPYGRSASFQATSLSIARRAAKTHACLIAMLVPRIVNRNGKGDLADGYRIVDNVRRRAISTTQPSFDSLRTVGSFIITPLLLFAPFTLRSFVARHIHHSYSPAAFTSFHSQTHLRQDF